MGLRTEQIVKILQLKSLGRKTALKLCDLAKNEEVDTDYDLQKFLLECIAKNLIQRLPFYSKDELNNAFNYGESILIKSEKAGIKILSIFDDMFPKELKEIHDKPIIINMKGNYSELNYRPGIAIIGTREPTEDGIKSGKFFGKYFGALKFNVVSGLAKGCDSAAHRGCLDVKGITTAIVAHGLHTVYPKENKSLAMEIIEKGGILLSEYFIGVGALANYFVERDRLQSGLARGTIVIQTGVKGGTMHAVKATLESGKPLAAVKYNVFISYDKIGGNEMLIKEGKASALTRETITEFAQKLGVKTAPRVLQGPEFESNEESIQHEVQKPQPKTDNVSDSFHELPDKALVEPPEDVYKVPEENVISSPFAETSKGTIQEPKESTFPTIRWSKRKISKPKKYVTKSIGVKRRVTKKNGGNRN